MQAPDISTELAAHIADGTIYSKWWFYIAWIGITAVGAAIGAWLRERLRGDVSKDIWLAQESWKEKYRLYTLLITASDEIASALWSIETDVRVLTDMGPAPSTEADGTRLFPEHRQFLAAEEHANNSLLSAEVGVELMLNEAAKEAFQRIKTANTRTLAAINMTYRQRVSERCSAASAAKVGFIAAAKRDLRI